MRGGNRRGESRDPIRRYSEPHLSLYEQALLDYKWSQEFDEMFP